MAEDRARLSGTGGGGRAETAVGRGAGENALRLDEGPGSSTAVLPEGPPYRRTSDIVEETHGGAPLPGAEFPSWNSAGRSGSQRGPSPGYPGASGRDCASLESDAVPGGRRAIARAYRECALRAAGSRS